MLRSLRVVLVICGLVLGSAIPAEAATASSPAVCVETNNVLFNPPLTTTPGPGVFVFNWFKACVSDGVPYTLTGADQYAYFGNCVQAQISNDVTVLGGVTYIAVHKTGVLIPTNADPCNFGVGTYVGDKLDNV
jgi:hypothetical protein